MSDGGYSKVNPCPYQLCDGSGWLVIRDGTGDFDAHEEPCECTIAQATADVADFLAAMDYQSSSTESVLPGSQDKGREHAPVTSGDASSTCWAISNGGTAFTVNGKNICHDRTRPHCHCLDQSGSWNRHEIKCPLPDGCTCGTRTDPHCAIHSASPETFPGAVL